MARGDAIFARCNVDWPNDPRCEMLPDNDARWLNHLMWLWCTKHRSPQLPTHYTVGYLAKAGAVTVEKAQAALRAMAELDLISVAPDGGLVVEGVTNQNSRLEWKCTEIEGCENPWKTDPKYLYPNGVPATIATVPNRKEQEQGKEQGKEQGDGQEPPLRGTTRPPDDTEELRDPKTGRPFEMPLSKKGEFCTIPRSKGLEWNATYGDSFNVVIELRKCIQYYRDKPTNCKTNQRNSITAIGNWMRKTQNDGTGQPALSKAQMRSERQRLARAKEADEAQAKRVAANIAAKGGGTTDGPQGLGPAGQHEEMRDEHKHNRAP